MPIIKVRHKKKYLFDDNKIGQENFESWVSYWRSNPHKFITDYLKLKLYDFQKYLIWLMFNYPQFIFVASRGLAKSTLALIFAISYCILYPGTSVVIVAPTKAQSTRFIKKVKEFVRISPNLKREIAKDGIKTGANNEGKIEFLNSSTITTLPYSENALGTRATILIVDEFVRTDKDVIGRIFVPMLTSPRMPEYSELTKKERYEISEEPNHQLYLSSIRRADEWSYLKFLDYMESMAKGDPAYMALAIPYNLGVKNRYISKAIVRQSFKENEEGTEMLLAEYCCVPEKNMSNGFYKYNTLDRCRDNTVAMVAMSNYDYIEYKNRKTEWPYYVEKLPNEIRILCMDVALVESNNNDNTAIFIIRLIPENGKLKRVISYGESIHGINSLIQVKRAKQLFYEFDCDYVTIDCMGSGVGIFDACTNETYDEERGETYPAWTTVDPDDTKNLNRTISSSAIPIIYSVKTGIREKSQMLLHSRDILSTGLVSLLVDSQDALEYLNEKFEYYKISNSDLKARILNSYVQTSLFIHEAVNLEQIATQGYINVKEKSGKRKDRVMSLVYGLFISSKIEEMMNANSHFDMLDYIFSV